MDMVKRLTHSLGVIRVAGYVRENYATIMVFSETEKHLDDEIQRRFGISLRSYYEIN